MKNVMPTWSLKKQGNGWVVVTDQTGLVHSNKPLPRSHALGQLRALYAALKAGQIKAIPANKMIGKK